MEQKFLTGCNRHFVQRIGGRIATAFTNHPNRVSQFLNNHRNISLVKKPPQPARGDASTSRGGGGRKINQLGAAARCVLRWEQFRPRPSRPHTPTGGARLAAPCCFSVPALPLVLAPTV